MMKRKLKYLSLLSGVVLVALFSYYIGEVVIKNLLSAM